MRACVRVCAWKRGRNLLRVGCAVVEPAATDGPTLSPNTFRQSADSVPRSHTLRREEGPVCNTMTSSRILWLLAAAAVAASALGARLGPASQSGCTDPKSGIVCPSPDDPAVAIVALAVLSGDAGAFADGDLVLQLQVRPRTEPTLLSRQIADVPEPESRRRRMRAGSGALTGALNMTCSARGLPALARRRRPGCSFQSRTEQLWRSRSLPPCRGQPAWPTLTPCRSVDLLHPSSF